MAFNYKSPNFKERLDFSKVFEDHKELQPLEEVIKFLTNEVYVNAENIHSTTTKLYQKFMVIEKYE